MKQYQINNSDKDERKTSVDIYVLCDKFSEVKKQANRMIEEQSRVSVTLQNNGSFPPMEERRITDDLFNSYLYSKINYELSEYELRQLKSSKGYTLEEGIVRAIAEAFTELCAKFGVDFVVKPEDLIAEFSLNDFHISADDIYHSGNPEAYFDKGKERYSEIISIIKGKFDSLNLIAQNSLGIYIDMCYQMKMITYEILSLCRKMTPKAFDEFNIKLGEQRLGEMGELLKILHDRDNQIYKYLRLCDYLVESSRTSKLSASKSENWERIEAYLERMNIDDKGFYTRADELIEKMTDLSEWVYPYDENGALKHGYQLFWDMAAALEISGKTRSYLSKAKGYANKK